MKKSTNVINSIVHSSVMLMFFGTGVFIAATVFNHVQELHTQSYCKCMEPTSKRIHSTKEYQDLKHKCMRSYPFAKISK